MNNQDFLRELERELKYRNYSPRTIDAYSACIAYFLKYIEYDITQISKEVIVDFVIHLQSKNRASKTINLYKEAIKFFTKEILKIPLNIDIKLSREAKKLPVVLTKSEILQVVDSIKNEKHRFIIRLSYSA